MAHTFEYAILTAIPNPRRGERVNIGVVVFRHETIDVRFVQAGYKLRALTGESWEDRLESAEKSLRSMGKVYKAPSDVLSNFELFEPLVKPSSLGWLNAESEKDYEQSVQQILQALVGLPRRERIETRSRINTEIAKEFRHADVMARGDESIEDGKVVRDFTIDESEGLTADFAVQNGKLHVASTLDLRRQTSTLGDAALKSIVLDKAGKVFRRKVRKIGVYAVDDDAREHFRAHISMLGDYADELYNWMDADSRAKFKNAFFDALGHRGDLL